MTSVWRGRRVRVENPNLPVLIRGKVLSYIDQPTFLIETDDGERVAVPAAWAAEDKPGEITSFYGIRVGTRWKDKKTQRIVKVVEFKNRWVWRYRDGERRRVQSQSEFDVIVNILQTGTGNKPRGRQGEARWLYEIPDFLKKFEEANE